MGIEVQWCHPDPYVGQQIRYKAERLVRHHPAFCETDADDVAQDLALELFKASARFDPARSSENTFIARVLDSKAKSLIRHRQAQRRDYRRVFKSLHRRMESGNDDAEGLVKGVDCLFHTIPDAAVKNHTFTRTREEHDLHQLKHDVPCVVGRLPDHLRETAEMLKEDSKHRVCKRLGISRREMANRVTELRKRFERAGLRDYLQQPGQPGRVLA